MARRWDPSRRTARRAALCLAAACLGSAPLTAQDTVNRGTLAGVLVDATNGARLPETLVTIVEKDQVTLTDAQGLFTFEDIPFGEHRLEFRQYGYQEATALVSIRAAATAPFRFEIHPDPLLVDGVTAVVDRLQEAKLRLERRRRAVPVQVRQFDQRRLLQTGASDMFEFLQFDMGLPRVDCGRRSSTGGCYLVRGRVTTPTVYIDEARMIGGIWQLETYRPGELYLVEAYQGGRQIRAYTHQFMERMARRPVALIPIFLP